MQIFHYVFCPNLYFLYYIWKKNACFWACMDKRKKDTLAGALPAVSRCAQHRKFRRRVRTGLVA